MPDARTSAGGDCALRAGTAQSRDSRTLGGGDGRTGVSGVTRRAVVGGMLAAPMIVRGAAAQSEAD